MSVTQEEGNLDFFLVYIFYLFILKKNIDIRSYWMNQKRLLGTFLHYANNFISNE